MAISDIHGRFEEFKTILQKIKKQLDSHRLVLLGDYIGYGPNSMEVLELVKNLVKNYGAVALKGNWEDMLYQSIDNNDEHLKNEFIKMLYKRGAKKLFYQIKSKHNYLEFINNLPLYYVEKNIVFSHSGVDYEIIETAFFDSLEEFMKRNTKQKLIWNDYFYEDVITTMIDPPCQFYIVAGHIPINIINNMTIEKNPIIKPFVHENVIGIDFRASSKKGYLGVVFLRPHFGCFAIPIKK